MYSISNKEIIYINSSNNGNLKLHGYEMKNDSNIWAVVVHGYAGQGSDMVYYALAKGCFYKAFLAEKYEDAFVTVLTHKEAYPKAYQEVLKLKDRFPLVMQGKDGKFYLFIDECRTGISL